MVSENIEMRVALVHDDLVQWGGAERVLLAMSEVFPEAPIFTSVYDVDNLLLERQFVNKKIITSFLQKIPGWKNIYKALLPFYPIAFEQFDFSRYDLVISHTTRFAKVVITKPQTRHICYCHTPPRFLWHYSREKTPSVLGPYLSFLRIYDTISRHRVDNWWAGSVNAQGRLKENYQVDADLLYPGIDLNRFSQVRPFDGGYYLIVCRLNFYKRADLAIEVFNQTGQHLVVVGSGPELLKLQEVAKTNIEFLPTVSDQLLINLLAGCRALIVTAEEDFGLTPVEAQAVGKPVIAFGGGGALETVVDGETGILFEHQTVDSLADALVRLQQAELNPEDCQAKAKRFSQDNFKKRLRQLVRFL